MRENLKVKSINQLFYMLVLSGLFMMSGAIASEPAQRALAAMCKGTQYGIGEILSEFPDSRLIDSQVQKFKGQPRRIKHVLGLSGGGEIRIVRIYSLGQLRRISIEHHRISTDGEFLPTMSVLGSASCDEIERRVMTYGPSGKPYKLDINRSGAKSEILLNPEVPTGSDPGGVLVAVIDTGVNYLLPEFSVRLARDEVGKISGYDFWDNDDRPFDIDSSRSLFFPLHHGTAVTSIILREAPTARILPYRYPRQNMALMADVIKHADNAGSRIISIAMGSSRREDWREFEVAVRARPHLLFIVSAGNDGRDIDVTPLYPAALDLSNLVTVTSSDYSGRLATGSNWGKFGVDIMVPGERIPVIDHRGVSVKASGSSFAVPRITALAARWLSQYPHWTSEDLKSALFSRARDLNGILKIKLKHGWIPDPTDDYLP